MAIMQQFAISLGIAVPSHVAIERSEVLKKPGSALGEEGLRIAEAVAHPVSLMLAYYEVGVVRLYQGIVAAIGIVPSPHDTFHTIRGVGGSEIVFTRRIDYLQVEERSVSSFEIEVGGID